MGEIAKYWISHSPGDQPQVWVFESSDSEYFYFRSYKHSTQLLAKKLTELISPSFKPMLIRGGKKEAA